MNAEAERRARGGARGGNWGRLLLQGTILVLAFLAMVGFSVVLAKVTLTPSPASEDLVRSNLHPGRSLRQYAVDYTFLAACKQAGGNLVLGMPFGGLLPVLVPRRLRMIRMVLLTVLVIVVVELVQGALVAGRAFDVDDVILNTAGALLGYLLLGRRLSHRYHVLAAGPERPGSAPEPPPAKDTAKETKARTTTKTRTATKPKPKGTAKAKAKAASRPGAKAAGTTAKPKPKTSRRPGREPRGGRPAMSWPRMWQGIRTRVTSRGTRKE
ncbi:VanZ family protein [Streptomyces sp. ITFR-16]|uniref:VanZ family protein n=1 Tax=Streptomyces sp. ITFR-16 TaxID=3075198 RepID=UPI002889040A|nr:VanZ family protein [Streptomyces sp. ITFR-16]WNI26537.1 VanZ family protein [Streptomyces sp. ITFR-16]